VNPVEGLRSFLAEHDLEYDEVSDGVFVVDLPGHNKLKTTCRIEIGPHALSLHAFVARHPEENHERVYRWLLERNLRMFGVAFAVDHHGDIYLDGRLPLAVVREEEIDRLLGSVLTYADESFNTILELGFATSIKREYEWRVSRGESLANLEVFRPRLESGEFGSDAEFVVDDR
jgi:hypothetical protein